MQVSKAVSPVFWATMSGMTGRPSSPAAATHGTISPGLEDDLSRPRGNVAGGWWWRDSAGAG